MNDNPLLLGHRGARRATSVEENTVPAFDLALEHGCDGFEFDVRRDGDGIPVICHDASVNGLTIAKSSHSQLQLPCLEDVLRRYASRAFLDIELKVAGLETSVLSALQQFPPERGYVVSSFLPAVVADLKARSGTVPLGIICDRAKQLEEAQKLPVEYVIPHDSLVTRQMVEATHARRRRIFVWTVNDPNRMRQLATWGVDAIISDNTELLTRTIKNPGNGLPSGRPN